MGRLGALVAVRCTAEELADWDAQAQASGVGRSDLIRARMAGGSVPATETGVRRGRREPPRDPSDPVLLAAVARIGNNVNQVARWANTNRGVDVAVLAELAGIEGQLRALVARAPGRG